MFQVLKFLKREYNQITVWPSYRQHISAKIYFIKGQNAQVKGATLKSSTRDLYIALYTVRGNSKNN